MNIKGIEIDMRKKLPPLLTSTTANMILNGEKTVTLDLGLTESLISKVDKNYRLNSNDVISEKDLKKIIKKEGSVFFIQQNEVYNLAISTKHYYKLLSTSEAPTIEIDGVRMHRTKNTTPNVDTENKIKKLELRDGKVLDTCMGLGYTAIEAIKNGAMLVYTFEIAFPVMLLAKMNPWSQPLFYNDYIYKIITDSYYTVDIFPDDYFTCIIHDPPTFSHAGKLYSESFYKKIHRVLNEGGQLFHYTGEPGSKYRGIKLNKGISNRLKNAGFREIRYESDVKGLYAEK